MCSEDIEGATVLESKSISFHPTTSFQFNNYCLKTSSNTFKVKTKNQFYQLKHKNPYFCIPFPILFISKYRYKIQNDNSTIKNDTKGLTTLCSPKFI